MKKWEKPMIQELDLSYTMEEGDDVLCYCTQKKGHWDSGEDRCVHMYKPTNKGGNCPPQAQGAIPKPAGYGDDIPMCS